MLWDGTEGPVVVVACNPGWYVGVDGNGNLQCTPCAPGSYKNSIEADTCTQCDAGKYSKEDGATACTQCQDFEFQVERGARSCEVCPFANSSSAGSQGVQCLCNLGFQHNVAGGGCQACPPGSSTSQTSVSCSGSCSCVTPGLTSGILSDGDKDINRYTLYNCEWMITATSNIYLRFL